MAIMMTITIESSSASTTLSPIPSFISSHSFAFPLQVSHKEITERERTLLYYLLVGIGRVEKSKQQLALDIGDERNILRWELSSCLNEKEQK
jgi:hypothetical protein